MNTIDVDVSEFRAFFQKMGKAASGDFRHEMELFLEATSFCESCRTR